MDRIARRPARVLSFDSRAEEQERIREMLERTGVGVPRFRAFDLVAASSLDEGLALLGSGAFDVALVCAASSPEESLRYVGELREHHRLLPVVLILDRDDERLAVEAASRGVQDCIVRTELVGNLLARSLQYAMERQDLQAQIERRSVVDELTGLYNRRGFFSVGEQEWRSARRQANGFLLVYADLDGLKEINDRDGHDAGDGAIKGASAVLAGAFRGSDILARLGGDEFAVIAHQIGPGGDGAIRRRLAEEIRRHNETHRPAVSLSLGIAVFDPAEKPQPDLDELLSRADKLMYEEKQRRRGG